ncbi:hypothetical protein CRE_30396 [Caenorhabditis remanei]|uniref:Uncharacterized protein n=1 Tax=Caenorhabditis remanei TaxID=31234 RepID=E3NAF4_CAERE|nr:hypothetical protein CRE_30396 [Caenorhabditis remanei]
MAHLLLTLLIIIPFYVVAVSEKRCIGTETKQLDEGCTIIESKPLIFKDVIDESLTRKKVKSITHLKAGLEILGTNIENFNYLSHVKEISNPNGPAITFRNNKVLKRVNFTGLTTLTGKKELLLDHDNLSKEASGNSASFKDLMQLEHISRVSNQRSEKCSKNFWEIKDFDKSSEGGRGNGWVISLSILLLVLVVILATLLTRPCHIVRRILKKKKSEEIDGKDRSKVEDDKEKTPKNRANKKKKPKKSTETNSKTSSTTVSTPNPKPTTSKQSSKTSSVSNLKSISKENSKNEVSKVTKLEKKGKQRKGKKTGN